MIASRYPILSNAKIKGSVDGKSNGAVVLDMTRSCNVKLLVVVLNTPCCNADQRRQIEVDSVMSWLREFKNDPARWGGNVGMPMILMGDTNFVGDHRQLDTILTGNIADELAFGEDFGPDWDGSSLTDTAAPHTHSGHRFTYYDEDQQYLPGILDYVFYSDSVLELTKSFVLFTPEIPPKYLREIGLKHDDSVIASDHLPVTADFRFKDGCARTGRQ